MNAILYAIELSAALDEDPSYHSRAVISEGCGIQVLLEDYNYCGGEAYHGYIFPGAGRESVFAGGRRGSRFPCFSAKRNLDRHMEPASLSERRLFGCYSLEPTESENNDLVFFEGGNSVLTINGEIPSHSLVKEFAHLFRKHRGKSIPCRGSMSGCERPDIVNQPDWEILPEYKFSVNSNFTALKNWEKMKDSGQIKPISHGFTEGWCTPDTHSIKSIFHLNKAWIGKLVIKCPCYTSRNAVGEEIQLEDASSLEIEEDSETYEKERIQSDTRIQNRFLDRIHALWKQNSQEGASGYNFFDSILRRSSSIAGRVSKSFIDLLYTIILLVIVLRTVIWWVEAM